MQHTTTKTIVQVRFCGRVFEMREPYPVGTTVEVLSGIVGDGVVRVRFPRGEETYLSAWKLEDVPDRNGVVPAAA